MKKILCSLAFVGLITGTVTTPVMAATTTHHHAKPHKAHHAAKHGSKKKVAAKKADTSVEHLKVAQTHLLHLNYYKGKVDGKMSPLTRTALKNFQKHNNIIANGKLTDETFKALEVADPSAAAMNAAKAAVAAETVAAQSVGTVPNAPEAPPEFYTKHPDFYGYYDQPYQNAMQMGPPAVPTRYGRVDVHERTDNDSLGYDVSVNDQPLFNVPEQPSVIGISRTFSLDSEDVIIFTTYRAQNSLCMYKNFLLVMNAEGTKTLEVPNCTRGYQAHAVNNDIFITFPEEDDARAVGATYRYEDGRVLKL